MAWSWKQILAAVIVVIGSACCGLEATPIEPNLDQLLKAPTQTQQFTPARAGWNGPESAGPGDASGVVTLERYSPEASAVALRHELQHLAVPDWRFVSALALIIVALRMVRQRAEQRSEPAPSRPSEELIPDPEAEELNPAA